MNTYFAPENILVVAIFLSGYALNWLISVMRERQGHWVTVEKLSERSIFTSPPQIGYGSDKDSLRVMYYNEPVNSLWLTELRIVNEGPNIPTAVEWGVFVSPKEKPISAAKEISHDVLGFWGNFDEGDYEILWDCGPAFAFKAGFMNSTRAFRKPFRLSIYSTGPLSLNVFGKGQGWEAKLRDRVERSRRIAMLLSRAAAFLSVVPTFGYLSHLSLLFDQTTSEASSMGERELRRLGVG